MGRVGIFVDGGYLDYVFKDLGYPRVDYAAFAKLLAGSDEILRTYYYHCLPYQSQNPTQEESERFGKKQRFFHALGRLDRFQVREGRLAFRGIDKTTGQPIFQQKGVDIALAVDLVLFATKGQINRAILISGDSDFLPAVQAAKNEGVLIHLYHGSGHNAPHKTLWDIADDRTEIVKGLIKPVLRP